MNEIVCWCPGWSIQGVFAPLRACCSRGSGAWALVRYLALVRAGGVWVRQPALFPVVVRRQARFGSQATERGEDPGLPPGKRPPGGLSDSGSEGRKSSKNVDFIGFLARSAWGHVEVF